MPTLRVHLFLALAASAFAQQASLPQEAPATITSVRVIQENNVPAIEIVSSRPVVPAIQTLDSPPRLVIDLPNTLPGSTQKRISVLQQDILTIRSEQRQQNPPAMRVVVDLLVPYGFSWDAAGNRLLVHLKPPAEPTQAAKPAAVPRGFSASIAGTPSIVPITNGEGDVIVLGSAAGGSISAGIQTVVLQLSRGGGEIRVCPNSTISVTPSRDSNDLMFGMSAGALEGHYILDDSIDTVLTPDFRILFAGSGELHYAVSTDAHGNTCVRGLRGNTVAATVSEMIGDRIYNVRADEQVVFRSGRIDKVDTNIPPRCGCPAPLAAPQNNVAAARPIPQSQLPSKVTLAQGENSSIAKNSPAQPPPSASGPETPLPPAQANDVHVEVEAPLVFQGKKHNADSDSKPADAPPAPVQQADSSPPADNSARPSTFEMQVQPPSAAPAPPPAKPRGVFHRIGHFFSSIFH